MAASNQNVVSALIPLYFHDDSSLEFIPDILTDAEDHQLFSLQKSSSLQPVISHIHNCLNSSNKRLEGLLLLEKFVVQSSTLVFSDNVDTWMKLLLQILKSPGETVFHQRSCKILSIIIKASTSFSQLSRDVAANVIPQLLPILLLSQDLYREEAIDCIKVCIGVYPGPIGSFRSKLEKLLLADLQSPVPKPASPSCLALLGACGPGGKNRIKHTEGWTTQFNKIYITLHNTLTELYQVLQTDDSVGEKKDGFQLNVLPESTPAKRNVLLHRLSVFCQVLSSLLLEGLTAVAKVPVFDILMFITRCLEVKGNVLLNRATTDRLLLLALLPRVHQTALSLLSSLILSCGSLLIPFSSTINKLFIQCLVWTRSKTPYGQQKQYSELRQQVYKTITVWLQTLGTSCDLVTEETDLIKEIISDISPPVDVIKLSSTGIQNGFEPPKKKKKKNSGYQDITQGMSSYRKIDILSNSNLTSNCLKALQLFVMNFGSDLKTNSYKDVQETVVPILLDIQSNEDTLPIPYSEASCRKRLYAVLKSCTMSPHTKIPSLLQCSIRLFTTGLQDCNLTVSSFCRDALSLCECLFHPRAPCLRGPNLQVSAIRLDKPATDESESTEQYQIPLLTTTSSDGSTVPSKRKSLSRSKVDRTSIEPSIAEETIQDDVATSNLQNISSDSEDEPQKLFLDESVSNVEEVNDEANMERIILPDVEKIESVKVEEVLATGETVESKQVEDMVMSFVDAGPDSD